MKVEDFAEVLYSNAGKKRVLKYFLFDQELLHTYFQECRYKPVRLAKRLGMHYQSVRKLLQSANLWKFVSTVNGKGAGDNLRRRVLKNQAGYKFSENSNAYSISYENGKRRSRRKLEHIVVIEESIGRTLKRGEVVHHIDGNKLNNSLDNLFLCSKREHGVIHKQLEAIALDLVRRKLITFQNGAYKSSI